MHCCYYKNCASAKTSPPPLSWCRCHADAAATSAATLPMPHFHLQLPLKLRFCKAATYTTKLDAATMLLQPPPLLPPGCHRATNAYKINKNVILAKIALLQSCHLRQQAGHFCCRRHLYCHKAADAALPLHTK